MSRRGYAVAPLILALTAFTVACASAMPAAPPEPDSVISAVPATPVVMSAPTASPTPIERPIYILDPNGIPPFHLVSRIITIDPDRRQRARERATRYVPEMAISPDGGRHYVIDSYRDRVTRGDLRDFISMYDAATGRLLIDDLEVPGRVKYKAYPAGQPFLFFSEDGQTLFLQKYRDPDTQPTRVAALDPNTLKTVWEGRYPICGGRIRVEAEEWLCVNTRGRLGETVTVSLDVVNIRKGETREILAFELSGSNGFIAGHAVSPDGNRLHILSRDSTLTVVDLTTNEILMQAQLEPAVADGSLMVHVTMLISPDGSRLYVGFAPRSGSGLFGTTEIRTYDTGTLEQVGVLSLRDPAIHFALSNEGDQLYTVSSERQSFSIYDTATNREIATIGDLGGTPARIIVPPNI